MHEYTATSEGDLQVAIKLLACIETSGFIANTGNSMHVHAVILASQSLARGFTAIIQHTGFREQTGNVIRPGIHNVHVH